MKKLLLPLALFPLFASAHTEHLPHTHPEEILAWAGVAAIAAIGYWLYKRSRG